MPETLAELEAQLAALNRARAGGLRQISYQTNGVQRSLEFRTDRELESAQNDLLRRINGVGDRMIKIASSKGLEHDEG
jgi:hypothetical protein